MMFEKPKRSKKSKHISNERLEDGNCEICGKYASLDNHELLGGGYRNNSIKYGFQMGLCRTCHRKWHDSMCKEEKDRYRRDKQIEIMDRLGMTRDEWIKVLKKDWR